MSHSLYPAKKIARPPSKTRVVFYRFLGGWSEADEALMQRAMDEGATAQVEMCRDGLWLTGPPAPRRCARSWSAEGYVKSP